MKSPYWQHTEPLKCPRGHVMGWLGSVFWLCSKCPRIDHAGKAHRGRGCIYVQVPG